MNTWCRTDAQNLNFAIASTEVIELLKLVGKKTGELSMLPSREKPRARSVIGSRSKPDDVPDIVLPSGKTISGRLFAFDADGFTHWVRQNYTNEDLVVTLHYESGPLFAFACHTYGTLEGVSYATYETQSPMVHAVYKDGRRNGPLRTWDQGGNRVYWCNFAKGKRVGLCCYFDKGMPRLFLEYASDEVQAVHLIQAGKVIRSCAGRERALVDDVVAPVFLAVAKIEKELLENERGFKKAVKDAHLAVKQKRVAQINPQRRAAMQERTNARSREMDGFIAALRRHVGG